MGTTQGTLLIADISGYTRYLASVELEHSLDILAWLIGGITGQLRGVWEVIEVEGDAVFAHAPAGAMDGGGLIATVDAVYASFADRRAEVQRRTTCPCRACRSVPGLDLKIVVHAGEYARETLGDARKLVGPSVILVHRLLKNSIVERTGVRGYGYLTDGALAAHSLEGGVSGTQHEEHYDIGTCRGIVVDLTARWRAEESRRMIFVTTEEAIASFEVDTTASPALAWRCLTTPHALAGWMADRVEERGSGPRGAGTVLHCVHGKQHFSSEIVDWKPYRFFTWRITMRGTPSMLSTVELLSGPHGGTRISYRVVPAGRVLSRLAGRLMAPILRSSMRQTGERLSRTLTEMEQEHAFALAGEGGGMVSEDPEKNIREGVAMSQPFIHIGTFRIKEGKFEEVTRSYREVVETVEEHEPRMIAFHGFVNEDGTEMTVIQLHPDTASMDFHMQVLTDKLGEYVARALGPDLIELRRSEYYGTPSESALEMDRQIPGLAVDFKPIHVAGFTRTTSG